MTSADLTGDLPFLERSFHVFVLAAEAYELDSPAFCVIGEWAGWSSSAVTVADGYDDVVE